MLVNSELSSFWAICGTRLAQMIINSHSAWEEGCLVSHDYYNKQKFIYLRLLFNRNKVFIQRITCNL